MDDGGEAEENQSMKKTFALNCRRAPAKGWTYVVMAGSAEYFRTKRLVKVRAPWTASPSRFFMALGDGTHKLPIKAEIRRKIGKDVGDTVTVRLIERLSG